MLPPASYQGHSYSSLWVDQVCFHGLKRTAMDLCKNAFVRNNCSPSCNFISNLLLCVQHTTLVRQHKRTGSNHVSIYCILVHMKLGTAAMFVLVPWLPPI
ncbi:unnamed protein product [Sphagnum tenellum]